MSKRETKPAPERRDDDRVGLERLVFFSDAVFSIAITLLALEVRLPPGIGHLDDAGLARELAGLWPKYLAFTISFVVIGVFWMAHHRKFRYIRRYDRVLIWLNLFLLMAVAFVPFPTAVISDFGNRTATVLYALNMGIAGLLSAAIWWYATSKHRLVEADLSPRLIRRELWRSLAVAAVFLVSVGVAFLDAHVAKFFWLLLFVVLAIGPR